MLHLITIERKVKRIELNESSTNLADFVLIILRLVDWTLSFVDFERKILHTKSTRLVLLSLRAYKPSLTRNLYARGGRLLCLEGSGSTKCCL